MTIKKIRSIQGRDMHDGRTTKQIAKSIDDHAYRQASPHVVSALRELLAGADMSQIKALEKSLKTAKPKERKELVDRFCYDGRRTIYGRAVRKIYDDTRHTITSMLGIN